MTHYLFIVFVLYLVVLQHSSNVVEAMLASRVPVMRAFSGMQRVVTSPAVFQRTFHSSIYSTHAGCNTHDPCNHEDTVVARCTHKISELLKPQKIKVTSSNDDPNGSHVSLAVFCLWQSD